MLKAGAPSIGDARWEDVLLLVDGESGTFTDDSTLHHTLTISGATLSGISPTQGSYSPLFNGTSDYATVGVAGDWNFGNSDHTIEIKFRLNSLTGTTVPLASRSTSGSNVGGFEFSIATNGSAYCAWYQGTSLFTEVDFPTGSFTTGVDYDVCVQRTNGRWYAFKNGVAIANVAITIAMDAPYFPLCIGALKQTAGAPIRFTDGRVEVRITASSRYPLSGYTPPTSWPKTATNNQFDIASLFYGYPGGAWDFTDPASLWSDTSRTTLATVGGKVQGVTDKSGNGKHLSTGQTGILRQTGTTGSYLDFPGSGTCYVAAGGTLTQIGDTRGWSAFTAWRAPPNFTAQRTLMDMDEASSRVAQTLADWGQLYTLTFNSDGTNTSGKYAGTAWAVSTDHIGGVIRSPTYERLRLDRSQVNNLTVSKNPRQFSTGTLAVGHTYAGTSSASSPHLGRMYAAVYLGRIPSTAELARIEDWLAARAGI
jgi:hypothetical protein